MADLHEDIKKGFTRIVTLVMCAQHHRTLSIIACLAACITEDADLINY